MKKQPASSSALRPQEVTSCMHTPSRRGGCKLRQGPSGPGPRARPATRASPAPEALRLHADAWARSDSGDRAQHGTGGCWGWGESEGAPFCGKITEVMTQLPGHWPSRQVSGLGQETLKLQSIVPGPSEDPEGEIRAVVGTLTLSFWKEWRKFPPSSPSSRGVPGGLLMPLMLLGEFCGETRGGEPRAPSNLPPLPGREGFLEGAVREETGTHSLLEVRPCHLTLEGRKSSSGSCPFFCAGASKCFHPNPNILPEDLLPRQHLPLRIFLWGPGSAEPGAEAAKASREGRQGADLPNEPFMWCGSMPPMPPIGPSEPGPIGNCGRSTERVT